MAVSALYGLLLRTREARAFSAPERHEPALEPAREHRSTSTRFSTASASPAARWRTGQLVGYCETTTDGVEGDCKRGSKGMWYAARHGVTDLRGCEELCACCGACRYVSFSRKHDDCSWYRDCAMPLQLAYGGELYRTSRVQQLLGGFPRPTESGCRAIKARGLAPSLPARLAKLASLVHALQEPRLPGARNATRATDPVRRPELSAADLTFMRATAKELQEELPWS